MDQVMDIVGSRDGLSFRKLFKLDYEPSGFTVDGEGCMWLAHKSAVKRYTAEGSILCGEGFRIPPADTVSAAPEAVVTALHCLGNNLCQLDLGSQEVKVLDAALPNPSARLCPGESSGALLVPGWWGRSQVHACTSEGELARRTSWFWGLSVVDSMLAVSSGGDTLLWVKDKKNPHLLKLARLPAPDPYERRTMASCQVIQREVDDMMHLEG
ncbi:hypothetical protein HaLaN_08231 [Haematococcus lacustris]|uniref:Uncharacterized protein n=1 Tax=Haematococcus lacustris TaxID=44745 RepID=A0A699YTG3_HAELA|nr:hypothetical protein HaLaN_08231 [Haematococcus lacustris]